MIITDGQIQDMPETKSQIVKLSKLGCSVIIIGVGNADFDSMKELDGDGALL
jgi:copine 5/8/9